jgi:hypothetical protein
VTATNIPSANNFLTRIKTATILIYAICVSDQEKSLFVRQLLKQDKKANARNFEKVSNLESIFQNFGPTVKTKHRPKAICDVFYWSAGILPATARERRQSAPIN